MNRLYKKFQYRISIVTGIIIIFFLGLFIQLFNLQIIQYKNNKESAEKITKSWLNAAGERGIIYDCNMNPITRNIMHYTFWVDPSREFDQEKIIDVLTNEFGNKTLIYQKKLNDGISTNSQYVELEKKINAAECSSLLHQTLPQGLHKKCFMKRYYTYSDIAQQLFGYSIVTDDSTVGIIGLEKQFDYYLNGEFGQFRGCRSRNNTWIRSLFDNMSNLKNGYDIVTTIDIEMQSFLQTELQNAYENTGAQSVSGLIICPKTGDILAMGTVPGFNLNDFGNYEKIDYFKNRVISDMFEPGSTLKTAIIAGALNDGLIKLTDTYDCENGEYIFNGRLIQDHEKHGVLTVEEILKYSSNIGMFKIVENIKHEDIYRFISDFGFGKKTGIELPAEADGILHDYSKWSDYTPASIAIGHELLVTVLQIGMMYCAIANDGYLLKPQILKEIQNQNTTFYKPNPIVIREVIDKTVAKEILRALEEVVEGGTGTNARIPGHRIAGKTSTAKKYIGGKYSDTDFISSFVGIFPASTPKYVCMISVDTPDAKKGYHYGNMCAAPAVRNVFKKIINTHNELYADVSYHPGYDDPIRKPQEKSPSFFKVISNFFGFKAQK